MTLREEMMHSEQPIIRQLTEQVSPDLLDVDALSYADALYSKLHETLESYVRTVHYMIRIKCVLEINSFLDGFFAGRFQPACRLNNVLNSTEIDILLLKILQAGSNDSLYANSQADRAEQFGMSVNAMQTRIHALEDGKDILGHRVQIHIAGRGQTAYDNTIHPVFLTLNLQEVFLLTIQLKRMFKETAYNKLADGIADDVYSQLSDYAKLILQPHTADLNFETQEILTPTPYRQEQKNIIYYLKSGESCRLTTLDGTEYIGKVECHGNDFFLKSISGQQIPIPEDHSDYTLLPISQA